jgi:cyclase
MITSRKIPVLQILDGKLVKTRKFKSPVYIGDPLNAVKIFNDKEVDELIILDISPERRKNGPNLKLVEDLLSECQMPVGYGGGVQNLDQAHDIFHLGAEKVIVNSLAYNNPKELKKISDTYGAQAISFSVDYDMSFFGNFRFFKHSGTSKTRYSLSEIINLIQDISCGEIILHNISSDGSFKGFDYKLLDFLKDSLDIPIVLLSGAKDYDDLNQAISKGAHSAAAGSMFVFQGPHRAVLIQY